MEDRRGFTSPPAGALPGLALLILAGALAGCEVAGWAAHGIAGGPGKVKVEAEYLGLEDRTVAVLVDADLDTMYQHPLAQLEVARIVSDRIAANVPGAQVRDARQVADFQQRNIYWNVASYSELAERLDAERLVLIDLTEYRLHEPGNVNVWRGTVSASLSVAEADGPEPDDLAYSTQVSASYPPNAALGVVNAEERTIRLGMLDLFARQAVGKFHDHRVERQK